MSGIGEGIGTAIEGGLLGRAIEPQTGRGDADRDSAASCANCAATFLGHYCPECGQKAHIHRSLAAIGHDIVHGVLHLDGKLWDTLPLLTFKPGDLTRRYVAGERAKFVSPMAMFLFTVFAMFAVFQMVGISAPADFGSRFTDGSSAFQTSIQQQITTLEQERDRLPKTDARRELVDGELTVLRRILTNTGKPETVRFSSTGIRFLDDGIIAKWQQNPSLMLYKLQSNGYKFSWLLIPLSVPFLWLMFAWRRQFKAYDHAVFVTYSLSFMSLLFIAMSIIGTVPGGTMWAGLLFSVAAPLHLYKQLRHAYGLTRFSALWRFCVLLFCTQFVSLLFLLILGILGAF